MRQRLAWIARPVAVPGGLSSRLAQALGCGVFVALFLYVFRPFGLDSLRQNLAWIAASYGLVTTAVMVWNTMLFGTFPRRMAQKGRWTVGHEMAWKAFEVFCLGTGNAFFSMWIGVVEVGVAGYLQFLAYTVLVGVFPVTFSALTASRVAPAVDSGADQGSASEETVVSSARKERTDESRLQIRSESGGGAVVLSAHDLLYAQVADNYIELVSWHEGMGSRELVRSTMKALLEDLQGGGAFFRCHRSFVVNMRHVRRVSGNARGYRLHLSGGHVIPVARRYNDMLRERVSETV